MKETTPLSTSALRMHTVQIPKAVNIYIISWRLISCTIFGLQLIYFQLEPGSSLSKIKILTEELSFAISVRDWTSQLCLSPFGLTNQASSSHKKQSPRSQGYTGGLDPATSIMRRHDASNHSSTDSYGYMHSNKENQQSNSTDKTGSSNC